MRIVGRSGSWRRIEPSRSKSFQRLDGDTGVGRVPLTLRSAEGSRSDSSAAGELTWQAGVQQSIFERSAGLAGILPSIVQLDMSEPGAGAAPAATGANASPSAQRIEISSRITRLRIGAEANCQ